ncbi:unnamed protein product [Rangifer tarandus platyrhynchus]|uniref:Uncharacterized protein n=2 Tax=Rangifer tarandus platyrhynchus TaxID=3082113 RepID=A0ABN8XW63_RANTA|nr:unnamed protein product [Rangifer tarandus platyrhynchus]CAI9690459.1 unnamed protein product [Rangifer tarandus platyrhynchus]
MTPGRAEAALPGLTAFQTQGSPGSPVSPVLTASADRSPCRDKTLPRSSALAEATSSLGARFPASSGAASPPVGASGDALRDAPRDAVTSLCFACKLGLEPSVRQARSCGRRRSLSSRPPEDC